MTNTHIAIVKEALGDTQSLAELHKCKDIFVADPDLLPDIHRRGLAIFNAAIDTDAPQAVSNSKPVAFLFQQVLESIGLLYSENTQRNAEATAPNSEDKSVSIRHQKGREHWETLMDQGNGAITVSEEDPEKKGSDDNESHINRLEAAMAARRKRKLLTHGEGKKTGKALRLAAPKATKERQTWDTKASRSPHVNRRSFIPLHVAAPSTFKGLSPAPPRTEAAGSKPAHNMQTFTTHLSRNDACPSLIVKLKVPNLSELLHHFNSEVSPLRRRKQNAYKSTELVTSDWEDIDSDLEMRDSPFAGLKIEDTNKTGSSGGGSHPTLQRRNAIAPIERAKLFNPRRHSTSPRSDTWETASAISTRSHFSITSSPPTTPPKRASQTSNSNSNASEKYTFPPLPKMPRRDRRPFYRGAQIALENILEDYTAAKEENEEEDGDEEYGDQDEGVMLLDLIEELEENRPKVYDWERKTVLKGGTWVYGVLRGVVEEVGGQGKGKEKGKGKGKRGDVGVRVKEVVNQMMGWVEGEFGRWK